MTTKNLPSAPDDWMLTGIEERHLPSWTIDRKKYVENVAGWIVEDWGRNKSFELDEWMVERIRHASYWLKEAISVDPDILGGVPVITGSRYAVSTLFAELAEGNSIDELAEDLNLDRDKMEKILLTFSIHLDQTRPW